MELSGHLSNGTTPAEPQRPRGAGPEAPGGPTAPRGPGPAARRAVSEPHATVCLARLRWKRGPVRPSGEAAVVVMMSRLERRRRRDVPVFLWWALRLRREIRGMPGAFGLGLAAAPLRGVFWTCSAWTDEAALGRYVSTPTTGG